MAMAEVAATPSHTSAAGAAVPAVAGSSSRPKSPRLFASSSTPRASVYTHQHPHPQISDQHQQPVQSQYDPTDSPGNGSSASYFSHHQRLSPPGPMLLSSSERNIPPRGLPPIVSPMSSVNQSNQSANDPRQPISPRTVSARVGDSAQVLEGISSDTAPRKRSKVSRACDECRRKKIRCDATSESGVEQCSSCKRVGSKCSFSRVPMKRGPSKGYIKELADRLNTLENSISTGDLHSHGSGVAGEGDHSPGPSDSTSPPPPNVPPSASKSRKRALSSSSDFQSTMHLQPLSQPNPTGRSNERLPSIDSFHPTNQHQHQQRAQRLQQEPQPQRQLPHPQQPPPPPPLPPPLSHVHQPQPQPQQSPLQPPSSIAEVTPSGYRTTISPTGMSQYWKGGSDVGGRRQSVSFPFDIPDIQRSATSSTPVDMGGFDWDDQVVDQYYEQVHPTFPLLPHSKDRLHQRLVNCSISVREAFLEALYSTVRTNPSSVPRANSSVANTKKVCELIVASQFENPAERTMSTKLLYLQTLILMDLETDNHGPATMRGQFGPPRAAWLGAAVGLACDLKLHNSRSQEQLVNGDPDSDEKLGRRAWVVLVILDRWHAISTSSPLFIPDWSVVFVPEDQKLLGLASFHIARLSCILGHLAEAFIITDESASATSFNPFISKILRGELERFRESVDEVWGSLNLLHVAYYHVKLLMLRHSSAEPHQLLGPAQKIAGMLASPQAPITPLNHHFAALSLVTLVELSDISETRDEAWKGIQQLADTLEERKGVATKDDSLGWDIALKDLIKRRKQERFGNSNPGALDIPPGHGSLQHLAELAVGERSPVGTPTNLANKKLDMEQLQRYGYLGSILL